MTTITQMESAKMEEHAPITSMQSEGSFSPSKSKERSHIVHKVRKIRKMNVNGRNMEVFAVRPSVLSSEYPSRNYRGFFNLSIILMVITNFRLVVENILKYGVLITPATYTIQEWSHWPGLTIGLSLGLYAVAAQLIELSAAKKIFSEKVVVTLEIVNTAASVIIPSLLVWFVQPNPGSGIVVMLFTVTLFMKLVSFSHVNANLRHEAHLKSKEEAFRAQEKREESATQREEKKKRDNKGEEEVTWPENLTWGSLWYFIAIPCLCYQLKYPRTPHLRWGFLCRRVIEGVFLIGLLLAIVEQYIIPLIHNSLQPMESVDILKILERILKLSIPNLYVWLLGFYVFFHIYMNFIAEILRYGDRLFYLEWWNSTTLSHYWRTWNLPVHQWMVLHVYTPCSNWGLPKVVSLLLCFTVSAAFHELVIAVPFQMFKWWSFFGMVGQLPLILMTDGLKGNQIGNVIFWFSIVLGQPFLVMMMYRAWYYKHFGFDEVIPSVLTVL